jgi:hypothetical protein
MKRMNPALPLTLLLAACASSPQARPLSSEGQGLLGPVIRHDASTASYCPEVRSGGICVMTQAEAVKACEAQGNHLPTAREFGEFSQANGAKGILEVSSATEKAPEGYYRVDSINPGNKRDDLHFSHEGYDPARGNLGQHLYWTASLVPVNQKYAHVFYGAWGGGGGDPKEHHVSYRHAVRCVIDRR